MSLSLRICLIGIATCSDDGGIAKNADTSAASKESVLDILGGGRFRVPDLSAQCRFRAFESAFQRANLVLSEGARTRLLILAANALSARGKSFERVARKLTALVGADSVIEPIHLERAMAVLKDDSPQASAVEFVPQLSCANEVNKDHFLTVGGNVEAKAALEEALALDPSKRALLGRFGMAPPTGVLLYGPPGTGKTLLAKAVAKLLNEGVNVGSIGGTFISLQAGDLVRSEVGHSEKLLVSSFDTARSNAPSVVFIDEFQALFAERSMSGGGKLASSLLQCMDDINKWKDADAKAHSIAGHAGNLRVVVMGATNVPWMVDKAFLRPGRFDRVVHVGLPTLEERKMILKVHVSRMRLLCCADKASQVDCICNELASSCDGWSGADLAGLCRAAAVRCLADCGETGEVSREHFLHARKYDVTRSSDDALVERLLAWKT
jgi:SpoVK/Ycf46/Vps4 family AAA+-type ATPase